MKPFLEALNLHRQTIVRDLALGLIRAVTLVFALAGIANYLFTVNRDTHALNDKAEETADNLASVLATPVWNLNTDELKKIVAIYRQSGVVADISVADDSGELIPFTRTSAQVQLKLTRTITHNETPIGRVTILFTDPESAQRQIHTALYSTAVFAIITIALIFGTAILLRRFLKEPLASLSEGLSRISQGDYQHQLPAARQLEISDMSEKIMIMAREIAKRESALESNRSKLKILNQAILDIFSCSDTESLIKQTMTLAFRVCGAEHAEFSSTPELTSDNGAPSLSPLVAVRGQVFLAHEAGIELNREPADDRRVFNFPIKSRFQTIGSITISFASVPDPTITALLRSLMSLPTQALIRQSFIRESAFIAAELQVAETVQRSMLVDQESKPPRSAVIAYHYAPVLRVGGDWFNVIESRDGNSVYVIMGDVTGHGLAQGLITTAMAGAMTLVESLIHDFNNTSIMTPAAIISQLNNVILKLIGTSNLRMTCVAAQIDFKSGRLAICNAGHTFPLILRQGSDGHRKIEALARKQQYMLGDDSTHGSVPHQYTDAIYSLGLDDLLVVYTDGLTEAVGKDGRSFARPFHRYVQKINSHRTASELRDEILTLFKNHTLDVPAEDDICLVVIGKRAETAAKVA